MSAEVTLDDIESLSIRVVVEVRPDGKFTYRMSRLDGRNLREMAMAAALLDKAKREILDEFSRNVRPTDPPKG